MDTLLVRLFKLLYRCRLFTGKQNQIKYCTVLFIWTSEPPMLITSQGVLATVTPATLEPSICCQLWGPNQGSSLPEDPRTESLVVIHSPCFTARGSVRGDWKWYGSTSNTEGTEIFLPIPGHITCKMLVRLPHSPDHINQSVYSVHWILATLRILISKNVKCQIKFEERIHNNNISKVSSKMSSDDNDVSPGHGDNNCRRVDNCRRCRTIKLIIVASASVLWTSHDALNALMIRKSADLRSRNYVGDILRRITILRYLQLQKNPWNQSQLFWP